MTGAIFFVVLLAVQLLSRAQTAPLQRRIRLGAVALLARALVFFTAEGALLALATEGGAGGALAALFALLLFLLLTTPRVLLRAIIVPCRLPRLAYWTRLGIWPIAYAEEAVSAAVVFGALCAARSANGSDSLPWLRQRLDRRRIGGGCGIVAVGLISALGGSRAEARALLTIADSKPGVPRSMRAIARDWLVADSARAGRWRDVVRLGRRGRGALRWSYAMARLAERLLRDSRACRDGQLWCWFLLAPRRRATWPLLRRALSIPVASVAEAIPQDFPHALGQLAQPRNLDPARLSAILGCLERRLTDLEANGASAVAAALQSQLIMLIEPLVDRDPELARTPGGIMSQVVAKRRAISFADIEARCREYGERRTVRNPIERVTEWQMWAMLRASAESLMILDPGAIETLFRTVYVSVCNFAVYQLNVLKNAPLAEDMFSWLYQYARPGSDEERLLVRNIRAAGGRTRTRRRRKNEEVSRA